ncbi:Halomucin [Frankliniella fusca]|uniref:Halomucin n=1 Tax=Frankliniella fusca TaxID=407009 RepID=A0AAE1L9W2_9NEOP|nr:Halomucin [Frankliniella fusca]
MAEEIDEVKWLIVWCDDDSSFSLIDKEDSYCDEEHLSEGDKIKFTFNDKEYDGVVRALGGDSDYDDLVIKLKELNAGNKKKDSSFHADQPRKNRGGSKFVEAVNALKPVKRQAGSKGATKAITKIKSECVDTDDQSGQSSSTTSPESSPPPESTTSDHSKRAANEKRKGKENDVQALKKIRSDIPLKKTPRLPIMGSHSFSTPQTTSESHVNWVSVVKSDERGPKENEEEFKVDSGRKEKYKNKTKRKDELKVSSSEDSCEESGKEDDGKKPLYKNRKGGKLSSSDESSEEKDKNNIKKAKKDKDKDDSSEESRKEDKGKKQSENNGKKRGKLSSSDESSDEEMKRDKTKEHKKKDQNINKKAKKDKKKVQKEAEDELDFPVMRCSADDNGVEEISGKSKELANKKIYVTSESLHKAKAAKNASIFSKSLLESVFTDEALYRCSVSGGEYRAAGRAKISRKPALPATIISIIIDVALHRQQMKKWSPPLTKKDILGALRQKLVDIRPRLKKLFEEKST